MAVRFGEQKHDTSMSRAKGTYTDRERKREKKTAASVHCKGSYATWTQPSFDMASGDNNKRSESQSRNRPSSRPTTPLRPSSRTSLRDSQAFAASGGSSDFPLDSLEPAFAELSDSMADLEANFMHLQLMHESLSRFNESFASFLYGMNMNAFCVDFPEV